MCIVLWVDIVKRKWNSNKLLINSLHIFSSFPDDYKSIQMLLLYERYSGADPENPSWGGQQDQRANHPRMLGCPISIRVEDTESKSPPCRSTGVLKNLGHFAPAGGGGGMAPLPPHWISPWMRLHFWAHLCLCTVGSYISLSVCD